MKTTGTKETLKQQQRAWSERRIKAMESAEAQARMDYDFASSGYNPLKFNHEQQAAIRVALAGAAGSAAARTFDSLCPRPV